MAKRLFHSCRSPSAAAAITPTTQLLATGHQPHVVPAPAGAACCPRGVPRRRPQTPAACGAGDLPLAPAYRWLKSSRWHVIEANAYATTAAGDDGDDAPRLKIDARRRVRRRSLRRRRRALHHRRAATAAAPASWSSDDSGWFSTDDEEPYADSATLVTASSTTTESSSTGANGNSAPGAGAAREEEEVEPPVAVAGGFAVVKRSEDPRADFRRSMAEMVVGRGIYDADGLERLLRCFLALNDQRHRRDIVAAFGDVWEAVFAHPQPNSGDHAASSRAAPSSAKPAATNVINS